VTDSRPGTDPNPPAGGRKVGFSRALAVLIAGAYFMENLDATILAPAAPAIAERLGVQPVQINAAMATLICTGWTPRLSAMAGAAGAMMVASRFSMKYAPAMSTANAREKPTFRFKPEAS